MRVLVAAFVALASGCVTVNPQPPPTAVCRDGTYSYGSSHGGVAQWLADLPP